MFITLLYTFICKLTKISVYYFLCSPVLTCAYRHVSVLTLLHYISTKILEYFPRVRRYSTLLTKCSQLFYITHQNIKIFPSGSQIFYITHQNIKILNSHPNHENINFYNFSTLCPHKGRHHFHTIILSWHCPFKYFGKFFNLSVNSWWLYKYFQADLYSGALYIKYALGLQVHISTTTGLPTTSLSGSQNFLFLRCCNDSGWLCLWDKAVNKGDKETDDDNDDVTWYRQPRQLMSKFLLRSVWQVLDFKTQGFSLFATCHTNWKGH
jgi:hypothetical protein